MTIPKPKNDVTLHFARPMLADLRKLSLLLTGREATAEEIVRAREILDEGVGR